MCRVLSLCDRSSGLTWNQHKRTIHNHMFAMLEDSLEFFFSLMKRVRRSHSGSPSLAGAISSTQWVHMRQHKCSSQVFLDFFVNMWFSSCFFRCSMYTVFLTAVQTKTRIFFTFRFWNVFCRLTAAFRVKGDFSSKNRRSDFRDCNCWSSFVCSLPAESHLFSGRLTGFCKSFVARMVRSGFVDQKRALLLKVS